MNTDNARSLTRAVEPCPKARGAAATNKGKASWGNFSVYLAQALSVRGNRGSPVSDFSTSFPYGAQRVGVRRHPV